MASFAVLYFSLTLWYDREPKTDPVSNTDIIYRWHVFEWLESMIYEDNFVLLGVWIWVIQIVRDSHPKLLMFFPCRFWAF